MEKERKENRISKKIINFIKKIPKYVSILFSSKKNTIISLTCLCVVLLGIIYLSSSNHNVLYSGQSTIEEVLNIGEMETFNYIYEGVATKTDSDGDVDYYVCYSGYVKYGLDMENDLEISEKKNTITINVKSLKPTIQNIDNNSLEYISIKSSIFKNDEDRHNDGVVVAKKDFENVISSNKEVYNTAKEYTKSVIESLVKPLLSKNQKLEVIFND